METIIYLKNLGLGNNVKAYNKTNLTSVDIFRNTSIDIQEFEDIEYLEERLVKDLSVKTDFTHWQICSRKEFNEIAIEFGKNYNQLISEL